MKTAVVDASPLGRDFARRLEPLSATGHGDGWWCLSFRGTLDEARQCELLRGRPLPGDPGQNSATSFFEVDGRRINMMRSGRYQLRVRVNGTPTEKAMSHETSRKRWKEEADARKARDLYERAAELEKMVNLPSSAEQFRERTLRSVEHSQRTLSDVYLRGGAFGFCVDAGTVAEIEGHFRAIAHALNSAAIKACPVVNRFVDEIRDLRAQAAKLDPSLQRMLATVLLSAADAIRTEGMLPARQPRRAPQPHRQPARD